MAEEPSTQSGLVSNGQVDSLEKEAVGRLQAARTWKSYVELDFKEIYFFCAPNRQRQINSMTQPGTQRMLDAPELNTDQAFVVVQDFVTAVVNAFLPEAELWCEYGPGMDLPNGVWDQVKDKAKENEKKIFGAIKASNFYPEIPKAFYPDLGIGTVGMWVQRPTAHQPIVCSAVPLRELEIDLGPYGEIDFRAAVRYTRNHYVRELVGEEIWEKIPAELKEKLNNHKPTDRTQVSWCFWRDWEEKGDEVWQHVVLVNNQKVHDAKLKGEGSCPLLVMRFNPTADWPHGIGPTYQALPTLRQIDELERMRINHSALVINPPITYPDDSFVNVAQGVEEGQAYPIRPGTEGSVKPIYTPPPPEAANYQYEEKVAVLRKLHFVDHPEQTGDTPPTATQWMDELARAQRRIGTPGLSFWKEGPAQIFLRFKFLLEAAGAIAPLKVDGRAVATLPRNPAQAAAEQQEVVKTMQLVGWFAQTFPEEFKAACDGTDTMKKIAEKARATLIDWRKADEINNAVQIMSKLMGDRPVPGNPSNPPVPGPAA